MIDTQALTQELELPEYAGLWPDSPGHIVELLNARVKDLVKSRFITARTVLAEVGVDGAVALSKLKNFASGDAPTDPQMLQLHCAVAWSMDFITGDPGIDVGHPMTRNLLDTLAMAGVINSTEAGQIKNLAIQKGSRAEELFGEGTVVTEIDVRAAKGE